MNHESVEVNLDHQFQIDIIFIIHHNNKKQNYDSNSQVIQRSYK